MRSFRKRDESPGSDDDFDKIVRRESILTWTWRLLVVLALVIALQHLLAHAGYAPLPISLGAQDLLVGYPTAAVFGIVGLLIWGRKPAPH